MERRHPGQPRPSPVELATPPGLLMAALYPDAQYRPLGTQTEPVLANHDIVCLHTMVGSLSSTDNYFHQDGYGGTESHFGVGHDGTVYQWQDLDFQADANLDGNDRVISIETGDSGNGFPAWSGSNVPAWTEAQLVAISELVAWLCQRYDIPCALIPDTRQGRRGIGYHRQGIDPWRVPDGERWSSSYGKVCPGDRRVQQITTEIIPRAQAILRGETDVPLTPDEINKIAAAVWSRTEKDKNREDIPKVPDGADRDTIALINALRSNLALVQQDVAELKARPSTPGGGATPAEVEAIIDAALANLKLVSTPST